jgi:hypothetical protein
MVGGAMMMRQSILTLSPGGDYWDKRPVESGSVTDAGFVYDLCWIIATCEEENTEFNDTFHPLMSMHARGQVRFVYDRETGNVDMVMVIGGPS